MMLIAAYHDQLRQLGLTTIDQVKECRAEIVSHHSVRRDVLRIMLAQGADPPLVFYVKRTWKTYRKDGLCSLLRHGRVWSASRREWENYRILAQVGVRSAEPVAYGEQVGMFGEQFSFLLTREVPARRTVEAFLRECSDVETRRAVIVALAATVRRMHQAGVTSPDLFTHHFFVDTASTPPAIYLIDPARLERGGEPVLRRRARDLAALNATAPLQYVSIRERMRFLRAYAGRIDRTLVKLIRQRVSHLLKRRKFRGFSALPLPSPSGNRNDDWNPSMGTQPHAPAPGPSYEQTRRRFDQSGAAADYAGKHGGHGRDRREQRCIARALAGIERGAAVLDLPCGAGRLAPMLVDMGFAVTEADNSQHMVTQARLAWEGHCLQTKREQTGVRFEVRDVMRTGYADGQFGAVVCNRLLHHFVEPQTRQAALAELRRICCGRVVVSFFNTFALAALRFRAKNWLRGRTPTDRVPIPLRQLKADAQAAGLEFVRALPTRWGVSPQWYAVFAPAGVLHAPPAALPQCAGAESP